MRHVERLRFAWRPAMLVALVVIGVLWVMAFDRCLYEPAASQPRTTLGCFVGSLTGTFVGLYLSAVATLGWLLNLMGGR